jgi:hypothetical protein
MKKNIKLSKNLNLKHSNLNYKKFKLMKLITKRESQFKKGNRIRFRNKNLRKKKSNINSHKELLSKDW